MPVLEQLEPRAVFSWFERLCAIPHGSRNTGAVSAWLAGFAEARGLRFLRDEADNVIIFKDASPGDETREPLILQGHMDMVCAKNPDCAKDMAREGLDLAVDGDTVYARGTTLGADDGAAVAMMLAVLDDDAIPHPPLEAVFTADEEIGMLGAAALDCSVLRGKRLLNLDSEEEGVFTVSCAGGATARCVLPLRREAFAGAALTLRVSGLTGGHSGTEIDKGRANAFRLLGRALDAARRAADLRVVSLTGGGKDNAIPAEAEAVILTADAAASEAACRALAEALRGEYREPGFSLDIWPGGADAVPLDRQSTEALLFLLLCLPNGVQEMSREIEGLVQTSLNLGIAETEDARAVLTLSVRSSLASQKQMLLGSLRRFMERVGGTLEISGDYPGWAYRADSPLRETLARLYTEQTGHAPRIEAVHAGLECGLFCGRIPGLDCLSIGPDLTGIHTPRERLHIASLRRTWDLLLAALREL